MCPGVHLDGPAPRDQGAVLDRSERGEGLAAGRRVRLQLLAKDLILSLDAPRRLSVRNALQGTVTSVLPDEPNAALVEVDVGGARVVARVTRLAVNELALEEGLALWVLVKAVTLRGHVFPGTPVAP